MHSSPSQSSATTPSASDADAIDAMLDQAAEALETGRLAEAQAGFEAVLRLDPAQFDAWNLLGVTAMQLQDLPRAIECIGKAIAIAPDEAMAHTNLGVAWMASQQPDKALPCFDQALALEPGAPEPQLARGMALVALQQWPQAIDSLVQALAQQPGNAEAHFSLGRAFLELQRHDEALASYNQAISLQPSHVGALINRGLVLAALARHQEALASYDQAIALEATRPSAHTRRGDALLALGRLDEALGAYDQSLALQPDQGDVLVNRGTVLTQLQRAPEAINSFERALALNPNDVYALANLGGVLRNLGRWDESLPLCERALTLDPQHFGANMNRANVLFDTGHWDAARQAFAKVESLQPGHPEATWAQGWCNLLQGNWALGFAQFESRWRKPDFAAAEARTFTQPLWLGETDLRGRTILLYAEQGLGDTLQFCRYAPQVAALGAKVVLEVQPPLKKLMQSLVGEHIQVVAKGSYPMPAFDCRCPLMSLPLALKTTLDNVPSPQAYLSADKALLKLWGERLGPKKGPRVGIAWSGNAAHRNDLNRSMPLATLLAALPPGLDVYVLQKDIRPEDAATLQAHDEVTHLPAAQQTFDDTAALIANMDLVISVDTSIAHLSGALGKPTWVLLSALQDWRWLLDRQDSPWYASARLFRQRSSGQWAEPLSDLAQALEGQIAQWQQPRVLH